MFAIKQYISSILAGTLFLSVFGAVGAQVLARSGDSEAELQSVSQPADLAVSGDVLADSASHASTRDDSSAQGSEGAQSASANVDTAVLAVADVPSIDTSLQSQSQASVHYSVSGGDDDDDDDDNDSDEDDGDNSDESEDEFDD